MTSQRILLARPLAETSGAPVLPDGYKLTAIDEGTVRPFHNLLAAVYEEDKEDFPSFDSWWAEVSCNPEFDLTLCIAVFDEDGRIAALAHCWNSGFLREIAVARDKRRRGLASALLLHLISILRERGLETLRLKVDRDNRHGARSLYRSLSFRPAQECEH